MTKRLSDDERLRRAMERVVSANARSGFKRAVCKAELGPGRICGLDIVKDGARAWEHLNATARHRIVVDRGTIVDR